MGKKLIIKDADFSVNGMGSTNITSLFNEWVIGTLNVNGNPKTSAVYKTSNAVDVSAYQGKTMVFTNSAYLSSGGSAAGFYSFFYDSNNAAIGSGIVVHVGNEAGKGYTVVDTIQIPSNAVTFKATYFDDSVTFDFDDFFCMIED